MWKLVRKRGKKRWGSHENRTETSKVEKGDGGGEGGGEGKERRNTGE